MDSRHIGKRGDGRWFSWQTVLAVGFVIAGICAGCRRTEDKQSGTPASQLAKPMEEPFKVGDAITNSIGMKLTYIPAGQFVMGSPGNEANRDSDETQHKVRITKPFLMGVTEVTQGQWKAVMGTTVGQQMDKADAKHGLCGEGNDYPMYYVSWDDAKEFCRKLTDKDGRTYRLPTEAEWEYACRAGTKTRFHSGDADGDLGDVAWFWGNSSLKTHAVGQKRRNAWTLYDMHGNVLEWCEDRSGPYPNSETVDPSGAENGEVRVLRGGSWFAMTPDICRAAIRRGLSPGSRNNYVGFRVVHGVADVAGHSE